MTASFQASRLLPRRLVPSLDILGVSDVSDVSGSLTSSVPSCADVVRA